ncbi:MAG: InlB B-repeat-containing protein [Clostridiaceae bacterium]
MLKKVLGLLIAILMLAQPVSTIAAEAPIVIGVPEENLGTPTDENLGTPTDEQPLDDPGEGSGDAVIPGTQTPEPETATFTVRFFGQDGALLGEQTVKQGDNANAPDAPEVEGFVFDGWDKPFNDVQSDLDVNAVYSAAAGLTTDGLTAGLMTIETQMQTGWQNIKYNNLTGLSSGSDTDHYPSTTIVNGVTMWDLWDLPQNSQYVITGWYDNPTFSGSPYSTYPISSQTPTIFLYAKWTPKTYTVIYDGNGATGGSVTDNNTYESGKKATVIGNENPGFTYPGYKFMGWSATPTGTVAYTKNSAITMNSNKTLYAVWSYDSSQWVTVKFYGNGSSDPQMDELTFIAASGGTLSTSTYTLEHYDFQGWAKSSDGPKVYNDGQNVSGTPFTGGSIVKLYAKWAPRQYSITYDLNGGTASGNPSSYTIETTEFSLTNPTRNGYTFLGWTGTGLSGNTKPVTISKGSTGDREYTANWVPIEYTITYNNVEGATNPNPSRYNTGDTVTLEPPTKEGYTFDRWTVGDTSVTAGSPAISSTDYGPKTFKANWTIKTYAVTFTAGAHGSLSGYTSFTVDHGALWSTIAVPNTIPAAGYRFKTWSPVFPAGTDEVTGPLSFEATFEPITYNIVYTLNGGTNHPQNPSTYTTEEEVTLLAPTKTGYIFLGWEEGDSIPLGNTGDKTFTATWEAEKYTLSYNGNGATDGTVPDPVTVDYNLPVTVAGQGTLVKTGYSFNGWADINGTPYSGTFNLTSSITLYAQWRENTYTLYYNTNGGTGALPPAIGGYKHGQTVSSFASQPPSLKKVGYTFKGWGTSADSGVASSVTFEYSNITLYAQWELNKYTVTFHGRNGDKWSQSVEYGKSATAPDTAAYDALRNDGYGFQMWLGSYTNVTRNLDIYGLWLPIVYEITYGGLEGAFNPNFLLIAYTVDSPTITLAAPFRLGYTFTGWTPDEGVIPHNSKGNRHFTATWAPTEYGITYDLNGDGILPGATMADGNPDSYTYPLGFTVPVAPEMTGYTFLGWTSTKLHISTPSKTVAVAPNTRIGNVTLVANWEINTYTVNFYGFDTTTPIKTQIVKHGDPATAPADPAHTGWTFAGWNPATFNSITGNLEVYSQWTEDAYTVNFYGFDTTTPIKTQGVKYGNPATAPDDPTHDGWSFTGWAPAFDNVTGNLDVFSQWTQDTYTVNFYGFDGITIIGTDTVTYNEAATAPADPTHDGYTFDGWDTDYTNVTDNLTIKSLWKVIDYPITYTLNGGTASGNPASYTIEDSFTLINPTRSGYTFLGWTGTGLSGNTLSVTVAKGSIGEREYTANWRFNPTPEETEIPLNPSTPTPTLTTIPENPVPGAPSPAPRTTPAVPAAPVSPVPSPSPSAPPTQAPAVTTPAPQQTQELVDIPEQEVPLEAQPESTDLLTLVNLIAMIVTVIGAIVLAFKKFGKKDDKAEQAEKEQKEGAFKRIGTKLIAAIAAVGGIVFFFLTQPLTPMDIWDKWSIWQLLILAVYVVMAIVAYSKKKEQDKEQSAKA